MSTPDEQNTVLGPSTDVSVDPDEIQEDAAQTRDAEATPDVDEDSVETGEQGGTEGAGGAG